MLTIRPRLLRPAVILAVALALLLAGCYPSHLQSTFDPQGPVAQRQATLFYIIFWAAAFVFVTVLGALLYTVLRFRRRPGQQGMPRQVHGNTKLEIAWSIAPVVVLAVIAVPTVTALFDLSSPPANALEVRVTAYQWWWQFEYPDQGIVTANEVHIPVGQPVNFTMTSADVIHSFWVPKLGGKQDIVPTRENTLWLQADEEGVYWGQCAEFCGVSHANMRLRVIADPPEAFAQWVAQQQAVPSSAGLTGPAAEGVDLFANEAFAGGQRCVFCHTVEGLAIKGKAGPDLTHVGSRITVGAGLLENTPSEMARWLRNPSEVKPGVKMPNLGLTEDQVQKLVAYLQSLK